MQTSISHESMYTLLKVTHNMHISAYLLGVWYVECDHLELLTVVSLGGSALLVIWAVFKLAMVIHYLHIYLWEYYLFIVLLWDQVNYDDMCATYHHDSLSKKTIRFFATKPVLQSLSEGANYGLWRTLGLFNGIGYRFPAHKLPITMTVEPRKL